MSQRGRPFWPFEKEIETKMDAAFYQLIADINDRDEAREIFGVLLTGTEKANLPKRLAILSLLRHTNLLRWEDIADILHVSLPTINKMATMLTVGLPSSFKLRLENTNRILDSLIKKA